MVALNGNRSDRALGYDLRIINSGRQSSFKVPRAAKARTRKTVQFRVCESESSTNVACTVHEFEKEDQETLDSLFWNQEELNECYNDGKLEMAGLRSSYGKALRTAYRKALNSVDDGSINFQEFSIARGLEMIVFPAAKSVSKWHRAAVLSCQESLRQKHDRWSSSGSTSYSTSEVLRIASQTYSQPSCFLALQLAQSDSTE